jgi:hypothetical protein
LFLGRVAWRRIREIRVLHPRMRFRHFETHRVHFALRVDMFAGMKSFKAIENQKLNQETGGAKRTITEIRFHYWNYTENLEIREFFTLGFLLDIVVSSDGM